MISQITLTPRRLLFLVIGCGGIGGNLVRDIPKLLIGSNNTKLMLIDGDEVEASNLKRQPYQIQDLKRNKARVLASKINSFYKINALYYNSYLVADELDEICQKYNNYMPVFLGCVDNDSTRKLIEQNFLKQKEAVYIDGANSTHEGNVFVSYKKDESIVGKLRSQIYALADDFNPGLIGCEEEIAKGNTQILVTNQKIATSMLEHIYSIITGIVKVGVTDVSRFKIIHY